MARVVLLSTTACWWCRRTNLYQQCGKTLRRIRSWRMKQSGETLLYIPGYGMHDFGTPEAPRTDG